MQVESVKPAFVCIMEMVKNQRNFAADKNLGLSSVTNIAGDQDPYNVVIL